MTATSFVSTWGKNSTPILLTLLLVLLGVVDLGFSGSEHFMPQLGSMAIFFWCIYWPRLMPAWFVFALGLFQDILFGSPLGIASLMNLLLWWVVITQRRYFMKEAFWVVWLVFSFLALLFSLMSSLVYSIYYQQFVFSNNVLMQWVLSSCVYPFIHKLFNVIHNTFLKHY